MVKVHKRLLSSIILHFLTYEGYSLISYRQCLISKQSWNQDDYTCMLEYIAHTLKKGELFWKDQDPKAQNIKGSGPGYVFVSKSR